MPSPVALNPRPTFGRPQQAARAAVTTAAQLGMTARGPKGDGADRLDRTKCAAADPFMELAPVINAAAVGDIFHNNQRPAAASSSTATTTGGSLAAEEAEGCWKKDSAELLSKGADAVGAGVKSMALASKPLKRQADGRLVPDGQGLLNLVSKQNCRGSFERRWKKPAAGRCSHRGTAGHRRPAQGRAI